MCIARQSRNRRAGKSNRGIRGIREKGAGQCRVFAYLACSAVQPSSGKLVAAPLLCVICGQVLRLRPAPGFLYTKSNPYRRFAPPAEVNYPHDEQIRSTSEEGWLPAAVRHELSRSSAQQNHNNKNKTQTERSNI